MCRIAGILNTTIHLEELQKNVAHMCEMLKHGGPDDEGIYTDAAEHVVLGNRRLALRDLTAAGHQPMHYANRYTITYNGELYNFTALKNELIREGLHFNTQSDTEVILAAFKKWNTHSFSKLNGMFAFALWDKEEKKLFLVRDAAGIKPLYYSTHTGAIAFSSEIRAFSSISYLTEQNKNSAIYQLAYGFIPEPVTTLAHVKPLPKGCFFLYDAVTKRSSLQSFSFFSFSNGITGEKEAKEIIYTSMESAVSRQMLADENVGIFLSGGTDSTIIAKLARQSENKILHTLSVCFEEESYSEKKFQDLVAKEINSTHHSILLKEEDFQRHFSDIIQAMDMPTCDGINTWFISKFASSVGLKAVLSGIGADELFGGYPSFDRMKKAEMLRKIPSIVLNRINNVDLKKYNRIRYLKLEGIKGYYLFLRGHFTPQQIAEQLGGYENDVWNVLEETPAANTLENVSVKNKAAWLEFNVYMQNQLLRDADVMSMSHGLEIRVPFLDDEVINTAHAITDNVKFKGNSPKQLLVETFEKLLPSQIYNRPKMGFGLPFQEWLKNSPLFKELANSNHTPTQKLCKEFLQDKLHWSRIMSLIVLKNKSGLAGF